MFDPQVASGHAFGGLPITVSLRTYPVVLGLLDGLSQGDGAEVEVEVRPAQPGEFAAAETEGW